MMRGQVKLSGDTRYTYSVGRVRVRERRLVPGRAFLAAAEAATLAAAAEELRDGGYELTGSDSAAVEALLTRQTADLSRFIAESLPDRRMIDFLRLPLEYGNLKAALVRRVAGHDLSLQEGGGLPPDRLRALAGGGDPAELPAPFGPLAAGLLAEWDKEHDPFRLEQGVDRALYTGLLLLARELHLEYLTALVALEIDLINLQALARCLAAPNPEELAAWAFLPDGTLERKRLEAAARGGEQAALELLGRGPYAELASLVVAGTPAALGNLTVRSRQLKLELLRQARYAPFGAEPVIAYCFVKRSEIELVRFILLSKANRVPAARIAARLWPVN